jgi:starch synthase
MRILLASSEVYPYSKTGGLADMVGSLAKALAGLGHRVGVVTPLYAGVREKYRDLHLLQFPLDVPLGIERIHGEIWSLDPSPGLTIYFVDQPSYFQRASLYQKDGQDYADNAERFIFLSKAVSELAFHLPWRPELLHVHDWQAAFAALFLHHRRKVSGWGSVPATCMTIHNLAYQGVFPVSHYALTNLPWDYFTPSGVEFYGRFNCLKAGIAFADSITTVSPRYAREITTEEFGCGLDGLLRQRQDLTLGILNGVDYEEWNPASDRHIPNLFSMGQLGGKTSNKLALQREMGLKEDAGIPLLGNIGRLVEQKGVDIMLSSLQELAPRLDFQFVLLGTGAPEFQRGYQTLARHFPGRIAVNIGFNEGLSHRVEAACDFFLMPSRFEPCGLNQMYSLRYGTIPIVRAIGGLDDSVIDAREDAQNANGIKFSEYSTKALSKAIRKGLALYGEPHAFRFFQSNAMSADFSWGKTAHDYLAVYERARTQTVEAKRIRY